LDILKKKIWKGELQRKSRKINKRRRRKSEPNDEKNWVLQ
jgi:hypothetical protein